jgi:hypothetical protein
MHIFLIILGVIAWTLLAVAVGVLLSKRVIVTMSAFYAELHHQEREARVAFYSATQRADDLAKELAARGKGVIQEVKGDVGKIVREV